MRLIDVSITFNAYRRVIVMRAGIDGDDGAVEVVGLLRDQPVAGSVDGFLAFGGMAHRHQRLHFESCTMSSLKHSCIVIHSCLLVNIPQYAWMSSLESAEENSESSVIHSVG